MICLETKVNFRKNQKAYNHWIQTKINRSAYGFKKLLYIKFSYNCTYTTVQCTVYRAGHTIFVSSSQESTRQSWWHWKAQQQTNDNAVILALAGLCHIVAYKRWEVHTTHNSHPTPHNPPPLQPIPHTPHHTSNISYTTPYPPASSTPHPIHHSHPTSQTLYPSPHPANHTLHPTFHTPDPTSTHHTHILLFTPHTPQTTPPTTHPWSLIPHPETHSTPLTLRATLPTLSRFLRCRERWTQARPAQP